MDSKTHRNTHTHTQRAWFPSCAGSKIPNSEPPPKKKPRQADRNQRRLDYLHGASAAAAQLSFHLTSAHNAHARKARHTSCLCTRSPLRLTVMYEREAPTYLPHPGHSYFYADNGGLLVFRQPQKRRSPRPLPKALIHECIRGGDTDAVRLCAGVGSINIGEYRYSSPLSGVFFFFFFPPMELLGPGPTLRCYWPPQTQSPAPACVT